MPVAYRCPINFQKHHNSSTVSVLWFGVGRRGALGWIIWFAVIDSKAAEGSTALNTLCLKQNGHHFADNICKCNFLLESCLVLIHILLKYVANSTTEVAILTTSVVHSQWRKYQHDISFSVTGHIEIQCYRPLWVMQFGLMTMFSTAVSHRGEGLSI